MYSDGSRERRSDDFFSGRRSLWALLLRNRHLENYLLAPQGFDAGRVIARHPTQDSVGVLPQVGCSGGHGELGLRDLYRERQHVGVEPILGDPRHPMLELGISCNSTRGVHWSYRDIVLITEHDPLAGRLGPEQSNQGRLELCISHCVVRELRSRPPCKKIGSVDSFAEVLPERLFAGHEKHVAIGRGVNLISDAPLEPCGARGPSFEVVTGISVDLVLGSFVAPPCLDPVPIEVRSRI